MTEVQRMAEGIETKILLEIRDGGTQFTPKQADDYLILLTAWYDKYSEELAQIEMLRAEEWLALRPSVKTNLEADMHYDMSQKGKRRIHLKLQLKSMEKMISALKERMRRLNTEAYHQY